MKTHRQTTALLSFLAIVFCFDAAVANAQLFGRRRCNPCWRQRHCCPTYCQPPICESGDCGTCKIEWDRFNGIWKIKSDCSDDKTCSCKAPTVATPQGSLTCECEDSASTQPTSAKFFLQLGNKRVLVDSGAVDGTIEFEVWDYSTTVGTKKWKVTAVYDTTEPPVNTFVPKPILTEYDATTTHYVYVNGSPFSQTQFWSLDDPTYTNVFGQWTVTITMY